MASNFSVLSLKRNRSSSSSKGSKINTILNKLASPFHHDSKKRKQQVNSHQDTIRKSNNNSPFGLLFIDYFRSEENTLNHPFANDTLFERNRYTTTKKQNSTLKFHDNQTAQEQQAKKSIITKSINNNATSGILVKQPPISFINNGYQRNHRHTNSTLSVQSSKSAYNHHRKGKKSSHVRHYSHVSCMSASNITVNSENLTAKEFADIAGIRILSEDEEYSSSSTFQSFNEEKKIIKRCAFCDEADDDSAPTHSSMIVTSQYNDDMDDDEEDQDNYTSHSSPMESIQDNEPDLNIWDVNFWQQPGDDNQPLLPYLHQNEEEMPILGQLRRSNYNLSTNQQDTIIKKGRFEIHLSHCNHSSNNTSTTTTINSSSLANPEKAVPTTRPDVMEWKRKKRPTTLKHQITA